MSFQELASFLWFAANLLRRTYKQSAAASRQSQSAFLRSFANRAFPGVLPKRICSSQGRRGQPKNFRERRLCQRCPRLLYAAPALHSRIGRQSVEHEGQPVTREASRAGNDIGLLRSNSRQQRK